MDATAGAAEVNIDEEAQKVKDATGDFADNIAIAIADAKSRKVYHADMVALLTCALLDLVKGQTKCIEIKR